MSDEKWKTIAYKFGKRWFCGNCGSGVDDWSSPNCVTECAWCAWSVRYPQSTGPTTTTREFNQSLWSREGSPEGWQE